VLKVLRTGDEYSVTHGVSPAGGSQLNYVAQERPASTKQQKKSLLHDSVIPVFPAWFDE